MPLLHLRTSGAQHPLADWKNQSATFGDRNEFVGRQQSQLRIVPADQRLSSDDAIRIELDHRLVVDNEFLPVERVMQAPFERQPSDRSFHRDACRKLIVVSTSLLR